MSVIAAVTAGLGIFKNWSEHKNKLTLLTREAEINLKKAEVVSKLKVVESQHTNNTQIDLASINKKGWMDELIGIIFFSPLFMMLLVGPVAAILSYLFGGIPMQGVDSVLPGGSPTGASMGIYYVISESYRISFQQMATWPQEFWIFMGLAFIHFLGMRGFVTQMAAHWSNKSLLGIGKSKK
tara:strand:- start:843 stop:1388 length:546 start_codon:yes stop_codon:yes gene_type:complete